MNRNPKGVLSHFLVASIVIGLVLITGMGTVTAQTLPELTVNVASMPAQIPAGQTITISAVVSNSGNINTNLNNVNVQIDMTDLNGIMVLHNVTSVNLTNTVSAIVNFNWMTTAGNYTAKIGVDPQNLITESDENNNTVIWTMIVATGNVSTPPPPSPVPVVVPVPIPSPVCPSSIYAPLITYSPPPCTHIVTPKDDLYINNDTVLQQGVYNIPDKGAAGVIIINADNIILDLNGATITGSGISNHGIGINVNNKTGVTIRYGNIRGYYEGIRLYNSNNCDIVLNNIIGNGDGIFLEDSSENTIDTNYVSGNILGIAVKNSSNNLIIRNNVSLNNVASSSYAGIDLLDSVNNTLALNTVSRNRQSGIISTSSSSTINDNVFYNNTVYDIDIDTMTGNSGTCNYGDRPNRWNDTGVTGFTFNSTVFNYAGCGIPQILPVPTPTPFPPCTPAPAQPTPATATPTSIPTPATPPSTPIPSPTPSTPGFGAVFTFAGLLVVMLVLRKRKI